MMRHLPMLACAAVIVGCATPEPQASFRKGYEHFQAGRYSEAAPILSQFLAPSGVSEQAHMMLAESYARMGEHNRAIVVFEDLCKGYRHPPLPSLYSVMGDAYFLTGNERNALKCWKRVHQQDETFDVEARIERLKTETSQQAPRPVR